MRRPSSPFLDDYVYYNSGNECPTNYHKMALLVASAALLECRVWMPWSGKGKSKREFDVYYPNMYGGLIGPQGLRKSSALGIVSGLLKEVDPEHPFSDSVVSKESVIKKLSEPDATRGFRLGDSTIQFQPLTFFLREFKHSCAINSSGLIDFLTHIYDCADTSSDTIRRGQERVEKPVPNLLICETTDWIVENMRKGLLTGGWARRWLPVVCDEPARLVAFPTITEKQLAARARVVKKMAYLKEAKGVVRLSDRAAAWYTDWYDNKKAPDNSEAVKGFYSSKHVLLHKIAMVLALADDRTLVLEPKHYLLALAFVDELEPGLFSLYAMAGRNNLTAPAYLLLRALGDGPLPEERVRKMIFEWTRDVDLVLDHLQRTKEIVLKENGTTGYLVHLHPRLQKAASSRRASRRSPAPSPASTQPA